MSTVVPDGFGYQQAVRYISDHLKENPEAAIVSLVNEAIARFDLSPLEGEHLLGFYRQAAAQVGEDAGG